MRFYVLYEIIWLRFQAQTFEVVTARLQPTHRVWFLVMRTHVAHKLVNTTHHATTNIVLCEYCVKCFFLVAVNSWVTKPQTKSSACRPGRDHWLAKWLNIVLIYSTLSHTREVLPTGCRCFAFGYEARSAEKRIMAPDDLGRSQICDKLLLLRASVWADPPCPKCLRPQIETSAIKTYE